MRGHILYDFEISRIGNSIETESSVGFQGLRVKENAE